MKGVYAECRLKANDQGFNEIWYKQTFLWKKSLNKAIFVILGSNIGLSELNSKFDVG